MTFKQVYYTLQGDNREEDPLADQGMRAEGLSRDTDMVHHGKLDRQKRSAFNIPYYMLY